MSRYERDDDTREYDASDSEFAEHAYTVREELDDHDRADDPLSDLPALTPQTPLEPLQSYGARVLAFLIATACTAVLSDDDLLLAEHCSIRATSRADLSPAVLERISDTKHLITSMLRARKADREASTCALIGALPTDKPNLGPMARLQDAPIVRPPSGEKVQVQF